MDTWMVEIRMCGTDTDTIHISGERMEDILSYLYADIKRNNGVVTSCRIDGNWFYIDSSHNAKPGLSTFDTSWTIVGRPAIIHQAVEAPACGDCGRMGTRQGRFRCSGRHFNSQDASTCACNCHVLYPFGGV